MSWETASRGFIDELATRQGARVPATLGEIWNASWQSSGLDTLAGSGAPLDEAYRELTEAVKATTGKDVAARAGFLGTEGQIASTNALIDQLGLDEEARKKIEPLRDVRRRAADKAREIEANAAEIENASYGFSGTATSFAAGIARQMVDPVNLATLPIGGPLLKGPVIKVLAREAGLGAGIQAIQEPVIQSNRAKLGLEAGFGEAAGNIAEAGLGAAGLAGLLRGAAYVGRLALGRPAQPVSGQIAAEGPAAAGNRATESPAAAASRFSPEDLEAAAMVAERDQALGVQGVGRAVEPERIDHAAEAMERGRDPDAERGLFGPTTLDASSAAPAFAQGFNPTRIAYIESDAQALIRPDGGRLTVRPAVVELADLTVSHNADGVPNANYPAELQPRDRAAGASRSWVAETAARLEPELLGREPTAATGAPVVGPDGIVEAGNGRALLIARAYDRHPDRAGAYRKFLEAQGYDVSQFKFPVLVRIREGEVQDRAGFARETNVSPTAGMSVRERALADAKSLDASIMDLWRGSGVATLGNAQFVRAFADRVVAPAERPQFIDAGERISAEGMRRVEAALVARGWQADDVVAALYESADPTSKAILGAMADTAPLAARMRAAIDDGRVDPALDPSAAVLDAFRLVERARDQGVPVRMLVDQIDLERGAVPPQTQAVARLFFNDDGMRQAARREKVSERLAALLDKALDQQQGPNLFGEAAPDLAALARAAKLAGESVAEQPVAALGLAGVVRKLDLAPVVMDAEWKRVTSSQPFNTIDEAMPLAAAHQPRLVAALNQHAGGIEGAQVKDPGIKSARERIEQKVAERAGDPRRVTDLVRAGVSVNRPADADAIVQALGASFRVIDEGWNVKRGYFDRKLAILFDDGMLGEVQIWPATVAAAKHKGNEYYRAMRSPDLDEATYLRIRTESDAHWNAVTNSLDEDWKRVYSAAAISDGGSPKVLSSSPQVDAARSASISSASKSSANREVGDQPLSGESTNLPAGVSAARSPDSLNQRVGVDGDTIPQNIGAEPRERKFMGEPLPVKGVAPANMANDGTIYVGSPGSMHFLISEKFGSAVRERLGLNSGAPTWRSEGFVTPDGRYLDRRQAFEWVQQNEGRVVASDNMGRELDALDYAEQIARKRSRPLGDQALAADAERALADAGGDLEIELALPDGNFRKVSARTALKEAEEDAAAARELLDCISRTTGEAA